MIELMVLNSMNNEDLIPFQYVFLLYETSQRSLPPDISSEISKFPPARQISSEHGSRVRGLIPLG